MTRVSGEGPETAMSQHTSQQTSDREQTEKFDTLAVTSEALPKVRDLRATLESLGKKAQDGDPDLDTLASELEDAEQDLRDLAAKAEYLKQHH